MRHQRKPLLYSERLPETRVLLKRPFGSCSVAFIAFLVAFLTSSVTAVIPTSRVPFRVHLTRLDGHGRNVTAVKPPRTQSQFFEDVLGIAPGVPFDFNVDKWRMLTHSRLFSNLSARAIMVDDGVALEIHGVEYPSQAFQPEVTMGLPSLDQPEISGGMIWRDFNFRGLGEKVEVLFSKKEGLEEGIDRLAPLLRAKWTSNVIGKRASIGVVAERMEDIETASDFLLVNQASSSEHQAPTYRSGDSRIFRTRLPMSTSSVALTIQSWAQTLNRGVEIYCKQLATDCFPPLTTSPDESSMETQNTADVHDAKRLSYLISGGKFFATRQNQHFSVQGDLDYGVTSDLTCSQSKSHPFLRLGFAGRVRRFRIPRVTLPWLTSSSSEGEISPDSGDDLNQHLTAATQCSIVTALGQGVVPRLHCLSPTSTQYVRGYTAASPRELTRSTNQMCSLQTDILLPRLSRLPWLSAVTFGFFSDLAVYTVGNSKEDLLGSHQVRGVATSGVSARFVGIKLELASPLHEPRLPRFYLGIDVEL